MTQHCRCSYCPQISVGVCVCVFCERSKIQYYFFVALVSWCDCALFSSLCLLAGVCFEFIFSRVCSNDRLTQTVLRTLLAHPPMPHENLPPTAVHFFPTSAPLPLGFPPPPKLGTMEHGNTLCCSCFHKRNIERRTKRRQKVHQSTLGGQHRSSECGTH